MISRGSALAGVFAAILSVQGAAHAAPTATPSPRPLRSLTFDVTYNVGTPPVEVNPVTGSQEIDAAAGDSGTLYVNILSAAADGALVADVAYRGQLTHQPSARVTILSDGHLSYAPGVKLAQPAADILPLVARNFAHGADSAHASMWTIDAAPPLTGATHYTTDALGGATLNVTFETDTSLTDPATKAVVADHASGSVVYDPRLSIPQRIRMHDLTRRADIPGDRGVDSYLFAVLSYDSLGQ